MSEPATVSVRDNPERRRFEAVDDSGEVAGFSDYRRVGDHITFTHTEVDDAHEGQGVGSVLVRGALDAVRAEGVRVVAQCPFVRAWIERHPEYADLL